MFSELSRSWEVELPALCMCLDLKDSSQDLLNDCTVTNTPTTEAKSHRKAYSYY